MNPYIAKIQKLASTLPEIRIMEVCGGHTNTIMRYGIREILPNNIKLISGPGCPVCVTSQQDIDSMIALAKSGIPVASYGDMLNVPGTSISLFDARAQGADVKLIYSIDELKNDKDRVFFGIGFETTTPMTAELLNRGHIVYSAHKLIPPAMKILVKQMNIDGFIDPGHVSAIIGSDIWSDMSIPTPQVICGFKPEQMLRSIYKLLKLIKNNEKTVINDYAEVVTNKGNQVAKDLIAKNFKVVDSDWRGMGTIPDSGLEPRNPKQNARLIYSNILKNVESKENSACICGKIVRGLAEPQDCPLFGKVCKPDNPIGACMVSDSEGSCAIAYKYGKSLSEK